MVNATVSEDDDTPKKQFLKRSVLSLADRYKKREKKIKLLAQCIRRQKKTISSLKSKDNI